MDIRFHKEYLKGFIDAKSHKGILSHIRAAHKLLEERKGKGSEFTGWLDLPSRTEKSFLMQLERLGEEVRQHSDCLVAIGIGGSYIGIRASLEFLSADQKLPVYYAGCNLSAGYHRALLEKIRDQRVTVVVISKSGTTTEPALAFRIIKKFMEEKYSAEELKKRIICVTDAKKGALKKIADASGFRSYPIDDDIGGRFSVLTPVGLVPLAIAGIDIKALMEGAREAQMHCSQKEFEKNLAYQYAAERFLLFRDRKVIEVLSIFNEQLVFVAEWWKQLYGESEGKDGKGIFPASLNFTADLHSMGQLLQEGRRNMFETFLTVDDAGQSLEIPREEKDLDNFNCVAGKDLDFVNKQAYKATAMAHFEGGVPNMTIVLPRFDAYCLGQLYYFFEKAVAMSGYLLKVNPFDQPGVEAYKNKMFMLLGRK
jgi:glucose-6-phosphate isomerase